MPSSSKNTFPDVDSRRLSATIMHHEIITRDEVLKALEPLNSEHLGRMAKLIFALPIKGAGTAHTLKQLITLSIQVDEELFGTMAESVEDKLESIHERLYYMLSWGQGMPGHDIARMELLSSLIGHMIEGSVFHQFRETAHKWLDVITEAAKE